MASTSLIRSAAAGSIAAGLAVLCWFNRLPKSEQDEAERTARDYSSRLLDQARKHVGEIDQTDSIIFPR